MEKTGLKLIDMTDVELVDLALEGGSQAAYSTLYSRYHKGICAHISRIITSPEEIEDICMESFEKAFKQLSTFKKENRFSTWMLTIARNTALDHKIREKSRGKKMEMTPIDIQGESVDVVDNTKSPEEEIIDTHNHESLISSILGLPPLYRDIAKMCFVDNYGYKEIAQKTDLPINTVKTRISRAKSLIVKNMQEMD